MLKGKVIFFNRKSNFGFIKNYSDDKNYYVHQKNLLDEIGPEDEVEFELKNSKRGLEAISVRKITLPGSL